MKSSIITVSFLFLGFLPPTTPAFAQEDLTAKQVSQRAADAVKLAGAEALSTMTIIDDKGRERVRKIAQVTKLYDDGDTEKKLIRFLEPADVKGTGLLTYDYETEDDDMWLFMPALRKTRRIVSSEKAKNFMGSEFTYADMTPPNVDDFTHTLLGEVEVDGVPCWEVEISPLDEDLEDEYGFTRKVSAIGKEDFVPRHAVYYDLDGSLHRELSMSGITELDPEHHRYRAKHLEMVNRQNGRKSIINVDQIQFNPDIKDDFFTTRYLERQ